MFYFAPMSAHYNFADLFELAVDKVPDRVALVDHRRRVTYRELDQRANRLAHSMRDAGVKPGDHVGIDAMNCIEWPEAALALYKLRAVPVNVNFRYVEEELRYLFENSDMVGIVYQREFGPIIAKARDAQPLLQRFWRIEDGTDADDSALDAVDYEDAVAAGSPERDWPERSDDDIYLLYTGGTTGMPKGVMWRQEDVYFALGGGIDVFTNEKVASPTAASDKIDPANPGIVTHTTPPLMHGAGQFGTFRMLFEGGTVVFRPRFDPEDVWRTIERERVNVITVTGDAMARPLADTLARIKDDVDISSLLSFGSTAAIFSQTVKEQLRELLGPNLVMTDAIGSTETGMNGIRVVQDGDAPKQGITTVLASADTTVLDDDLLPLEPGSGKVGRLARGQHPARLLPRSREDGGDVRHRRRGQAVVDPRRLRHHRGRRSHHAARSWFGLDQLRRREDLSRRGRRGAEGASRRVRRAGGRCARRALGGAGDRRRAGPARALARARRAGGALPHPDRQLQDPPPAVSRRNGAPPAQRQARLPEGEVDRARPGGRRRLGSIRGAPPTGTSETGAVGSSSPRSRSRSKRNMPRSLRLFFASVLALALGVVPTVVSQSPADAATTTQTPVMGPNLLTAAQLANWYNSVAHDPPSLPTVPGGSVQTLAQIFIDVGSRARA